MGSVNGRVDAYLTLLLEEPPPPVTGSQIFVANVFSGALHAIVDLPDVSMMTSTPFGTEATNVLLHAGPAGQQGLASAPGVRRLMPTARPEKIPVLLQLRRPDWSRDVPGMTKGSQLGSFLSAIVNAEALRLLAEDPDIVSVEASRGGVADCVHSMPFVRADIAHATPLSETGAGAMVAVIDEGIDVLHEAFRDSHGRTRIAYVWDQLDPTGPTPSVVDPAFAEQQYGTLHTQAAIDGFIAAGSTGRLGRDPLGHGTHVTSIAAGSPVPASGFPGGVAPEATLLIVIAKLQAGPGDPQSMGYSVTHLDALAFIRAAAHKLDQPVVVNVSLGQNAGSHDGLSPLELAFDAFSGGGREPGRVIVKSAGNEFGFGGHAYVQAFEGGMIPIRWQTDSRARAQDYLEFWYRASDDLQFTVVAPTGLACIADHKSPAARARDPAGAFTIDLRLTRYHRDNGDSQLLLLVWDPQGGAINVGGEWRLEILGQTVRSDGGVDGWVERDDLARAVNFETGNTNEETLSIPATARTVITVGACSSHDPLSLFENSSRGPTRDARPKPELVAPGIDILAARSGTADQLVSMSGTSMAAPHVTGATALLFARRRRLNLDQLNAAQVRAALNQSVRGFSGRWQSGFGTGRLDVVSLLQAFE